MSGSETSRSRSEHIVYELPRSPSYEAELRHVLRLVLAATAGDRRVRILDVGCGRGELLRSLRGLGFEKLVGTDVDLECCRLAGAFADTVRLSTYEVAAHFGPRSFDVVICSHVLEHLRDPIRVLWDVRAVCDRHAVLPIPNPHHLKTILRTLLHRPVPIEWSDLYGWDAGHLLNFLERFARWRVYRLGKSRVPIFPHTWLQRRASSLGGVAVALLSPIGDWLLPVALPYFGQSRNVLCEALPGFELPARVA